jgi:hypothetical protein
MPARTPAMTLSGLEAPIIVDQVSAYAGRPVEVLVVLHGDEQQ